MATVIERAICGQGRLGGRVAAILAAAGSPPLAMRLSREQGLLLPLAKPPLRIRSLILCLVPRPLQPLGDHGPQRASPAWAGLLDGLLAQVQRGEVVIDRLLHVSSTAVYEGYSSGWLTAETPPSGDSPRALALAEAEQRVRQLAFNTLVVRLTGLYGPGYERYQPLAMSFDKARMGVDVRAAAALIAALLRRGIDGAATALVTDGQIYHQGQAYPTDPANPLLAALACQQRLLLPSHPVCWPPLPR